MLCWSQGRAFFFFGCWLEGFHKLRPFFGSNGAAATEEPPPKPFLPSLEKEERTELFNLSALARKKKGKEKDGREGRRKKALVFFLNFLSLFRLREKSFFSSFLFCSSCVFFVIVTFFVVKCRNMGKK